MIFLLLPSESSMCQIGNPALSLRPRHRAGPAAISHFHAAADMQKTDTLARQRVVVEAVRGWRNRAPAHRQADAMTDDVLARVREVLRMPRRGRVERMESPETAQRCAAWNWPSSGARNC